MLWRDLEPDTGILEAIQHAGPRPGEGSDQNVKRRWSERFANGCAVALAAALRQQRELRGKRILPSTIEEGTEPLTPLGRGTKKRIDVTVTDSVLGLEIGISLKGFNFVDEGGSTFGKNLTGRLYELNDEVRLVHEHLPHAFMVAVLFVPIAAASDGRTEESTATFANAVFKLRERTGRLDTALAGQASRCDAGFVALYTLGHPEDSFPPGLVRFFDVTGAPPRRGRPKISQTLSLAGLTEEIVRRATDSTKREWGDAEID